MGIYKELMMANSSKKIWGHQKSRLSAILIEIDSNEIVLANNLSYGIKKLFNGLSFSHIVSTSLKCIAKAICSKA